MAETVPGSGHEPGDPPNIQPDLPVPAPPPVVGPPNGAGTYNASPFFNTGRARFYPPAIRKRLFGMMQQGGVQAPQLMGGDVHPGYLAAMQGMMNGQQGGWWR